MAVLREKNFKMQAIKNWVSMVTAVYNSQILYPVKQGVVLNLNKVNLNFLPHIIKSSQNFEK